MPTDVVKVTPLPADAALDRYFLETRCKLIEIAAHLDRVQRGEGSGSLKHDRRLEQIREAVEVLRSDRPEKTKACQMIFSLPFQDGWMKNCSPPARR